MADIARNLKGAEGAAALGVRLALGNPLPIEVRHLLDQVEVLEQDGSIGTDGKRMFLAGDGYACIRGRGWTKFWRVHASPFVYESNLQGQGRDRRRSSRS